MNRTVSSTTFVDVHKANVADFAIIWRPSLETFKHFLCWGFIGGGLGVAGFAIVRAGNPGRQFSIRWLFAMITIIAAATALLQFLNQ